MSQANASTAPTADSLQVVAAAGPSIGNENSQANDTNIIPNELFIDNVVFFRALQDNGVEMNAKEKAQYLNNRKNKTKTVKRGDRFYSETYKLAKDLHTHYKTFLTTLLPNIRKNDSDAIRMLGRQLLEMRQTSSQADIHSVVTDSDQMDISRSDEFKNKVVLSFLSQTEWLKWIISKWGKDDTKEKEATCDDIIRAVGIMFMEDMREFIPYVLSAVDPSAKDPTPTQRDPSKRLRLDGWNSKRNWTFRTLRDRFVDPDVVVPVSKDWNSDEARRRIDERLGDGVYDEFKFNPNNPDRIKIARTEKEVQTILGKGLLDYNKMMIKYKKNTGGGDGNPIVVAVWQDRDPLDIVGYATNNLKADVHLTLIHLWDKQYEFPLTIVKESGTPGGGVDDDDEDYVDFFDLSHGDDRDDDGSRAATPTNGGSNKTPKQSKATKKTRKKSGSKTSQEQHQLASLAEAQKQDRREHLEQLSEVMKDVFQSKSNDEGDKIDMVAKLQDSIATTEAALEKAEKKLKGLKKRRREAKEMAGNSPSNRAIKKKFDSITKKAKLTAKKVSAFQSSLEDQLEQLQRLSGTGKKEDDADDDIDLSDISDDSDSGSDSESDE